MAIPHAKPGDIVDVRPLGSALASSQTTTLIRADQVEVIRLVVPAGMDIAEHKAKGEIVVQCLEGRVAFTAFGKTQNLRGREVTLLARRRAALGQGHRELLAPADDPSAQALKRGC
jgi:quercetin dioxygenase-like cupin family protein